MTSVDSPTTENQPSAEPLIVSVSGLRGVVGQALNNEVAAAYALAFAETLPSGPLVIGRDGRESGPVLKQALATALTAAGRDVFDCDIASTPTVGVLVAERGAAGGIQISASHNPARYNGLKLFSAAGRVLPATAGDAVKRRFEALRRLPPSAAPTTPPGRVIPVDGIQPHLERVLALVDAQVIKQAKPHVWIDCGHGAGSRLARPLLEALGCKVTMVGEPADGLFEHEPEPTAENLADWLPRIAAAGADIGFFQDPDADRLAIATGSGHYLGEELTLALAVDAVLAKTPGPVVTNCSTSGLTARLAQRHGVSCTLSAVGEANVVDEMLARQAVLGGEGNGGVIDPRVGLVRDSFVAMALVLERMAAGGSLTPLESLVAAFPELVITKTKVELPTTWSKTDFTQAFDRIEAAFPEAGCSRLDGIRIDWPEGWLLVRASNTEPIVRIVAESETAADANAAIDLARSALLAG
jgi:phosphomannomutase